MVAELKFIHLLLKKELINRLMDHAASLAGAADASVAKTVIDGVEQVFG